MLLQRVGPKTLSVLLPFLFLAAAPAFSQLVPEGPLIEVTGVDRRALLPDASAVAANAAGDFAAVWERRETVPWVVEARLYDRSGAPKTEVLEVGPLTFIEDSSAVAMDSAGGFLVVWSAGPIRGRRYDASGVPQGAQFFISPAGVEGGIDPAVAATPDGFVAVWRRLGGPSELIGRLLGHDGQPRGPEFLIAPLGGIPDISVSSTGDFQVVWTGSGGVRARKYSAAGSPLGEAVVIAPAGRPVVAQGAGGTSLVVWSLSGGALGRRLGADGNPLGEAFLIVGFDGDQYGSTSEADVASDGDGNFLVAWEGCCSIVPVPNQVYARLIDSEGRLLGSPVKISSSARSFRARVSVAGSADGDFVALWSEGVVVAQRVGRAGGVLSFEESRVRAREGQGTLSVPVERGGLGGAVSVRYRTEAGTAVAGEDFTATTGTLSWGDGDSVPKTLTVPIVDDGRDESTETFSIVLEAPEGASLVEPSRLDVTLLDDEGPRPLGDEVRVVNSGAGPPRAPIVASDPAGNFLLGWRAQLDLEPATLHIRLYNKAGAPRGPVFDLGEGADMAAAWLSSGDYLVVWSQDSRIRGRLFTASGVPRGAVFPVSTGQDDARAVAVAADGKGGFVVVWSEEGGSAPRSKVLVRRFSGPGVPLGAPFIVSGSRVSNSLDVDVAPDGTFVVLWRGSVGTFEGGIFVRPYSSQGVALRAELRVDRPGVLSSLGDVGMDAAGNFVVVWAQELEEPSIRGRSFDRLGRRLGGEFRVNSSTAPYFENPAVGMYDSGDFVVLWSAGPNPFEGGEGLDGSFLGIFGQRYDPEGHRVGAEFSVNAVTAGDQRALDLAVDSEGGFVAAWRSDPIDSSPASGSEVFARRFTSASLCAADASTLCLNGGRFKVRTRWKTADGASGEGRAVPLTADTGFFWFFNPANVEMVVKALDACGLGSGFWIFAGGLTDVEVETTVTDTATGFVRTYLNPRGTAFLPIQDTAAFATCNSAGPGLPPPVPPTLPEPAACGGGPGALCLGGGRFRVEAEWTTGSGQSGTAQGVQLTSDTGYLWFFNGANVEMVVKLLDACGFNQRFWLFAGGLTDVQVSLRVTDTVTGAVRTYANPQGTAFRPIQDTGAFATCP